MRPLDDAPSHWAPRLEGAEDQSRQRTIDAKRAPFDSRHPADVEQADGEDVARAVSLADASCREHRRVAAYDRADWLHRAANALEGSAEVLVESLVRLIGKPRKFGAAEVRRGPALLRQCTEEVAQMDWENLALDGVSGAVGLWGVTRREPYGVVAAITPFNAPVNLLLQKVGPAIATGNAVVVKPAPDGAVVALQLAEVFEDALPARLLSVLPGGSELARELIARPEVRDVSLTGRVAAGEAVRRASGVNPVQLELGSNSEPRVLGRRSRAGGGGDRRCGVRREWAACISAHRVIVEALVVDTFAHLFASGARALVVGDPSDRATDLGPLVSEQARRRVARHMEDAETRDAKVVLDGRADHLCVAPASSWARRRTRCSCARRCSGPWRPSSRWARSTRRSRWRTTASSASRQAASPPAWPPPCGCPRSSGPALSGSTSPPGSLGHLPLRRLRGERDRPGGRGTRWRRCRSPSLLGCNRLENGNRRSHG